jgi:hypothetical protein
MHTTRRHPSIFSGNRKKGQRSPDRPETGPALRILATIFQEKIRQLSAIIKKKYKVPSTHRRIHGDS